MPTCGSIAGSPKPLPEPQPDGATVWVQDYQLQLVPRMLRDLRPDLVIGYFHHIPFPAYGLYSQLPWRKQVLEGSAVEPM